jgi:threonyl-tRNA synthetase
VEAKEKNQNTGADDQAFKLHRLRHSAAHVMAEAIGQVFPEANFAIGPAIDDGFYYDVDVARPITEEDLVSIEKEMKMVCKRNSQFHQEMWTKEKAKTWFAERGQNFKVELIEGIADEEVSIFHQDGFTDLCRGPHVSRTKNCKHFKLLKVSGAYWRGDAKGPQLQRIYGTVWPTRVELDQYLHRLEEAKKRDHRVLGKQLGLVMFHEYAPGCPFFLPKGEILYHELSEAMRSLLVDRGGYVGVRTPQMFDSALWKTSGHWEHYAENMFSFGTEEGEQDAGCCDGDQGENERITSLKPMNCPSHMLIFGATKRSYRELPMRIHDQGVLHRNEPRGALGGLTRVRQFCQDDAHLFVTEEQIEAEVTELLAMIGGVYEAFDLGFKAKLSTRPEKKLGDDALWDRAETALEAALTSNGLDFELKEGDGAFYGPKIDFDVVDALGREWQCATIQLDYQLPERFELKYVGADNELHTPIVIHRAIFGSLERFIAILIEHYAGAFPTWIAPEQVRILTVSEKSASHGEAVQAALKQAGLRVHLDGRDDKIGFKIREAHNAKIPWMAIIGEQEMADGTVSLRLRNDLRGKGFEPNPTIDQFVDMVKAAAKRPF